MPPLRPGAVLGGKYEILDPLGEGGMARVYRARDASLNREVAIKLLQPDIARKPRIIARLKREARVIASISDPGIVRLLDFVEGDDVGPFIVLDFVRGRTMFDMIPDASWTRDARMGAVEQVARAMHAVHERGIVHRDLKPGNVMIDASGRAVVMDFGIAQVEDASVRLTQEGTAVGTPVYMAPEQVRGDADGIDARTDVYAIGGMLYEVLTGQPPFRLTSLSEIFAQILNEMPRPIRSIDATLSAECETVCRRALAKSRELRYPNALALADDLERVRRGEDALVSRIDLQTPIPGVTPRPHFKHAAVSRRVPWTPIAITLAAVGALVAAMWIGWRIGATQQSPPSPIAATPPPNSTPAPPPVPAESPETFARREVERLILQDTRIAAERRLGDMLSRYPGHAETQRSAEHSFAALYMSEWVTAWEPTGMPASGPISTHNGVLRMEMRDRGQNAVIDDGPAAARGIRVDVMVIESYGDAGPSIAYGFHDDRNLRVWQLSVDRMKLMVMRDGVVDARQEVLLAYPSAPDGRWMDVAIVSVVEHAMFFHNGKLVHVGLSSELRLGRPYVFNTTKAIAEYRKIRVLPVR